jgi:phosphoglycolate phosphatase
MKIDSILIDLDGTLWDPVESIIQTWQNVIDKYADIVEQVSKKDISDCLGLNTQEIEEKLFPKATVQQRTQIMKECMEEEHQYLREHGSILYPKVEETLAHLADKYKLAIVSNCESGYIECFFAITGLERYFDTYLCYGDSGQDKGENIKTVLKHLDSKAAIYVGDTSKDALASRYAGIPFVYARYGYGNMGLDPDLRDYAIDDFCELIDIIEN